MFPYLYRSHGECEIWRYRVPRPFWRWRVIGLELGYATAPWLNGVRTALFHHILTLRGVRRATFLY